jgi:mono/diheme cytochrome c family protein
MKMLVLMVALSFAAVCSAADTSAGKAAYDKACKSCHGADGTANPAMAKMLKVEIKDLGSAEVQGMSDEELSKIITKGKGKMPAVHSVTGKSVDEVVAYVRTFKKK